ncbi:MAG: hypothetical protein ACFFDN_01300 [Candidatus Hodarchaeota archaeon]
MYMTKLKGKSLELFEEKCISIVAVAVALAVAAVALAGDLAGDLTGALAGDLAGAVIIFIYLELYAKKLYLENKKCHTKKKIKYP